MGKNRDTFEKPSFFVAKYNVSGILMWAKGAGGMGFDEGQGIAVDTSGNSHFLGWFEGSATFGIGWINGM